MKRKILHIAFVFVLIVNISAFLTMVYNKWVTGSAKETGEQAVPLLHNELQLNEAQAEDIENTRLSFENDVATVNSHLTEKQYELFELVKSPNPDYNKIDSVIEEIARLQVSLQKNAVRNLIREKNTLTPVQQQKYFSAFENRFRQRQMLKRGIQRKGQHRRRGNRWQR